MDKDTRFVYIVEGEPYVGTMNDYAKALEESHYSDFDISHMVWMVRPDATNKLDAYTVTQELAYEADDYRNIDLYVALKHMARARIDLRA